MPEYLAPGVYVEETSFRAKSIEGVSTTTTGFVGPTRYGPIDIAPEVITSLVEFERAYGSRHQLNFTDGQLHNYMWHAVRAFFEEGGKRLYASRVFLPMVGPGGDPLTARYNPPAEALADDAARPTNGKYREDGHARCWLTKGTAAVGAAADAVAALGADVKAAVAAAESAEGNALAAALVAVDVNAPANALTDADALAVASAKATRVKLQDVSTRLATAETLAVNASTAYANSTIAPGGVKAARDAAVTAAELTSASELDVAVLSRAAAAAHAEAVAARQQVAIAADKAKSIVDLAAPNAATPEVKDLAGALLAAAKPGGSAELAFKAAEDKANAAKTAAADAAAALPADLAAKRAAAVTAAKAAAAASKAAADQGEAVLQASVRLTAKADEQQTTGNVRALVGQTAAESLKVRDASRRGLDAARRSAYPRAFAAAEATAKLRLVATEFDKLSNAAAATVAAVTADAPAADHKGALLLRARFPGDAGNMLVRFTLRLAQNGLVQSGAKAVVRGLLPGDFVWIGGAEAGAAGKLYIAGLNAKGSDWYFSEDGTADNAAFWLNQPEPPSPGAARLVPGTHAVRSTSVTVQVFQGDETSLAWEGLALHPDHKRSGASDSLTDKFRAKPSSAADARLLPFVILKDDTVITATHVFRALFNAPDNGWTPPLEGQMRTSYVLLGGNDGQRPGAGEYVDMGGGKPDDPKMGLKTFEDLEDVSIVAAPGSTFGYRQPAFHADAALIVSALITHAEYMKYRIAVLDSGDGQSIGEVLAMRGTYDSKHAALYYPWVRVLDPVTRGEIDLPPSGFVAGIYARNDIERAVYKAPANEVVRGALGFEKLLNKAQQEVLNPEGVNCFRFFEGRGHRLWGARTISSDSEWKYVNVRRYFAYLERSIDRGTQWAVFEPNGEALWANVRRTIEDFLLNEWQNGALLGEKPEKAYFVKCDRSTMTQNDLDNGRLVCLIGVAPLKPAEFVIFRIGQWTADRKI